YAQYVAQLAHNASRLVHYVLREPRYVRSPELIAVDSLRLRAIALDPFVRRSLEEPLLKIYSRESSPRDQFITQALAISGPERVRQMEQYLSETAPYLRGVLAYARGFLREAVQYWGNALSSHQHDWMWAERAQAFFELRQFDSARANISRAVDMARAGDDTRH